MSNANEPAFPFVEPLIDGGHHVFSGLTKREQFAAMAMQGWLAGCGNAYAEFTGPAKYPEKVAEACVKFADALLAEFAK